MSDYSTALQPRGRVHYFVNEIERADGDALGLRRADAGAARGGRTQRDAGEGNPVAK